MSLLPVQLHLKPQPEYSMTRATAALMRLSRPHDSREASAKVLRATLTLLLCLLLAALTTRRSAAQAPQTAASHSAVKPVARPDKFWTTRHERFLQRAKEGRIDLLFLGDSITQAWEGGGRVIWRERYEPLNAANFGISGDRTQHVLWRLREGKELQGIHPKAVVLMIGTNNMGSNSVDEIADGITAIVHELRKQLPNTRVLLLGVFPRSQNPTDPVRTKIKEVNQRIAKLDDRKNVYYLDIGDKFLNADASLSKEIMPDYLHLSPKGYAIWANAIQSTLDQLSRK
jgi:lysophospholipase L1-like esterase